MSGPQPKFTSPANQAEGQHRVLIAEDDPVFSRMLRMWLERWNYQVIVVDNGRDAWNILRHPEAPKMAVLDWMMPEMDGVEVCRKMRTLQEGPYRYIVLLTARDQKQDVVEGLEAGADDYLTKPFNVDELRARVRAGKRILELQDALLQAQQAVQFEAAHDPLTGIWNRGAILTLLRQEIERALREHHPLAVLMADVDHFKAVNDQHGHLVGDAVLREVTQRLAGAVRTYDAVGRFGGEEFLVLLPGCSGTDVLENGERLRRAIADHPFVTTAGPLTVTVSLGAASMPADAMQPSYEAMLHAADDALYDAKAQGRNRMVSAEMQSFATPAESSKSGA